MYVRHELERDRQDLLPVRSSRSMVEAAVMLVVIADCEAKRRYLFATPRSHDRAIRIVDLLLEPYLTADFRGEVQAWNDRFHGSSNSVQEAEQVHVLSP